MSCSICQSMTFHAIAGSRLDGSVRYESVSVPPCVGVSDEELGLLPPPPASPPQAASPSESASRAASTTTTAAAVLLEFDPMCHDAPPWTPHPSPMSGHRLRCCGSNASRSPSPTRLNASTVIMMARPG